MNPPDVIVYEGRVYRLDRIAQPLAQDIRVRRAEEEGADTVACRASCNDCGAFVMSEAQKGRMTAFAAQSLYDLAQRIAHTPSCPQRGKVHPPGLVVNTTFRTVRVGAG